MNLCADCSHFQTARPLTQVLAEGLGRLGQTVASELSRLMQDERQLQDAEAAMEVELLRMEQLEWPQPPAMTDCCALHADRGLFLVATLKNSDGECEDFAPGPAPQARSCETCRHLGAGQGPARDEEYLDLIRKNAEVAALAERHAGPSSDAYIATIEARQALEVAQAYYHGRMVRPPDYLAHCRKFSRPGAFVPCAVQNAYDRCGDWEASNSEPRQERSGLFVAAAKRRSPT
jgi:hypothetical protein